MTYPDLCKLSGMSSGCAAPEPVYVFFVHGRGLLSRLISWQTWGKGITHCGLMDDGGVVIHATLGRGVEETRLEQAAKPGERIEVYKIILPRHLAEHLLTLAHTQIGKKYDILGNLGFILRWRVERRSKWFCSELVAWAFHQVGRPLLDRVKWYQLSPAALHRSPLLTHVDDWIVRTGPNGAAPYLQWTPPLRPPNAQKRAQERFSGNPPTDTDGPPPRVLQHHATGFSSDPRPSQPNTPDNETQNG